MPATFLTWRKRGISRPGGTPAIEVVQRGPRNELLQALTTGNGPQSNLSLSGRRLLACVTACITVGVTVGVGRLFQLVVGRLFQGDQGVVSFR